MTSLAPFAIMTLLMLVHNVYVSGYVSKDTVKCGRRVCVPEAVCRNNNWCRCNPPYIGVGHFKCYTDDYVSCHVIDDPYLTTFCSEKASVPIPCRYRMTSLTAGASCQLTVFTKNHFYLDYLSYATGVEVKVGVLGDFLNIVYDVTPGTAPAAYYKLGVLPQINLSPGTYNFTFLDRTFVITLDASDRSFTVDSTDCALSVVFRPPAGTGSVAEQMKTPGVACTVRRTASFQLGYPEALCGKPSCSDIGLGVYQSENSLDTAGLAVVLAWLKSETRQAAGSQCETTMETFNNLCNTQALSTQAVNVCGTIFSSPTIKCITRKFSIMDLFTRCIAAICSGDQETCNQLDMEVEQARCSVPTLTATCLTITPTNP